MKKSDLYETANHDKERILRTLRAAYAGRILSDLNRLRGSADKDMIERVLEDVHARLPEISPECDVSLLVTDCVHRAAGLSPTLPNNVTSGKSSENPHMLPWQRLAARRLRIARYSIPLSILLVLIVLLLLYFFPPF